MEKGGGELRQTEHVYMHTRIPPTDIYNEGAKEEINKEFPWDKKVNHKTTVRLLECRYFDKRLGLAYIMQIRLINVTCLQEPNGRKDRDLGEGPFSFFIFYLGK